MWDSQYSSQRLLNVNSCLHNEEKHGKFETSIIYERIYGVKESYHLQQWHQYLCSSHIYKTIETILYNSIQRFTWCQVRPILPSLLIHWQNFTHFNHQYKRRCLQFIRTNLRLFQSRSLSPYQTDHDQLKSNFKWPSWTSVCIQVTLNPFWWGTSNRCNYQNQSQLKSSTYNKARGHSSFTITSTEPAFAAWNWIAYCLCKSFNFSSSSWNVGRLWGSLNIL